MTSTEPSANVIPSTWTTRRVILATLVVLLVVVGFLLIYRFRAMILIVFCRDRREHGDGPGGRSAAATALARASAVSS